MTVKIKGKPQIADAITAAEFSIVGIGASAGGLAAFEAFFSAMPADVDTGMAFVLVQHLAPDHKSILTEIIRRYTRMQVSEVVDGMKVEPNCAYIIPPNRDMAFMNGSLQLLEPSSPRGQRLPIDFFFRSLAADQHERAICIVLSGTGSDGTLGVRAIKGEGGMVMAQKPESTEYDGMPCSAIATGLVDYVLSPAEMPAQLVSYATHAFRKQASPLAAPPLRDESQMKKVFVLLRSQVGHDFSGYKQSTIVRRTERRMAVHQIDRLEEYVRFLQKNPVEVEALFNDYLINVTSFFRDTEAFAALAAQVIPNLFAGKSPGDSVRVWVPGCSTGEEAYSIAILLQEQMEARKQYFKLQVFATDIDRRALDQARSGIYPVSVAADISPERLARFFTQEPGCGEYRIRKNTRDILVFSEQNVIKDPPFSKVDLISCRNLLIYLDGPLQKKILPLFHYALNPGGFLFLGTSETVGDFTNLFFLMDRSAKCYQRKSETLGTKPQILDALLSPTSGGGGLHRFIGPAQAQRKDDLREITERTLLAQFAPNSVLVSENGKILYFHGNTGRFFEPAPGVANLNILKMAREGLRLELSDALRKAAVLGEKVCKENVRFKTDGGFGFAQLSVHPVGTGAEGHNLFLVALEESPRAGAKLPPKAIGKKQKPETAAERADERLAVLSQELQEKEDILQSAREELETSNEELKSSNEEMQSVNEELQSTNEELETSKEELQSINEELSTVNNELQTKVTDLSQVSNDMNNLLAGTGVGTVFLDHQQRIRRFTPSVTALINLIPSDVGRPVGHILTNLIGYDSLVKDVQSVLDSLVPKEVEVHTQEDEWFMLRIRPYRTLENVIEGAVVVFFNITGMKRLQIEVQKTSGKAGTLFAIMPQGVLFQDASERIIEANPAAQRILGLTDAQMKGNPFVQPHWKTVREDGSNFPKGEQPAQKALATGQAAQGTVMGIEFPHKAGITWLRVNSIPLFIPGETTPYQVVTTLDEITGSVDVGKANKK